MTHEVRADKAEMDAIESGEQTAIVRRNNNYFVNDALVIHEFNPKQFRLGPRCFKARITHMKNGNEIQDGAVLSSHYSVISIRLVGDSEPSDNGSNAPQK